MKNPLLYCFLVVLFSSCLAGKQMAVTEPPEAKPARLDGHAVAALLAMEQAKLGTLDTLNSYPYARIPFPERVQFGKVHEFGDFRTEKLSLTRHDLDEDGHHILKIISLAVDSMGRKDLRSDQIIYRPEDPTDEERQVIAASLQTRGKQIRTIGDASLQDLATASIREYQEKNGLTADGVIGPQTIGSLLEDTAVLEIQEIRTRIVYPENPEITAYIIPDDAVDAAVFNKGFASLNEVEKHALSLDQLKQRALTGEGCLVCIYFKDRPSPAFAYRWGISDNRAGSGSVNSAPFYVEAGNWPIVVESLSFEGEINSDELFINLYRVNSGFLKLSNTINSSEIL